jgi:hypothetical protein
MYLNLKTDRTSEQFMTQEVCDLYRSSSFVTNQLFDMQRIQVIHTKFDGETSWEVVTFMTEEERPMGGANLLVGLRWDNDGSKMKLAHAVVQWRTLVFIF